MTTKPTQAQIEAGEYDLKCTNGHDRCYMGTSDDCPYCERVALTAAAEVGDRIGEDAQSIWNAGWIAGEATTIERCAQVAETFHCALCGADAGAAIRALKDKP